jgi:hypothetical protein
VPQKQVDLEIKTSSQVINYPWPQTPPAYPQITMNGAALPKPGGNAPTGYQVVVLDSSQDITTPGAIVSNQAVTVFPTSGSNSWMSTYQYVYSRMVRQILTSGNPGSQLIIVASFGMDNNMPPTNDAFGKLVDYGAGPQLQKWATHCDTGSQVGNSTSWVSFPTNYIFVGREFFSYGQGSEAYATGPSASLSVTLQTFGD